MEEKKKEKIDEKLQLKAQKQEPVKQEEITSTAATAPTTGDARDPYNLDNYAQIFNLVDERLALCPSMFGMPWFNYSDLLN